MNKSTMLQIQWIFFSVFFLVSIFSIFSISIAGEQQDPEVKVVTVTGVVPTVPAPAVKPGLWVRYYTNYFQRSLKRLPTGRSAEYPSFIGAPVLQLDHAFGRGEVFSAGESQGVGMRMKGFLHFRQSGIYVLQALSNDGITVEIDGKLALSDTRQHSDRLSNKAEVKIEQPGWYPVQVGYFQRKGTATLRLLWQEPGETEMTAIPKEAYGHLESP